MKQQSLKSSSPSVRCAHLTASGRRCRQLVAGPQEKLCFHHRSLQLAKQAADFSGPLLSESQGFQTAQGINFALTNLYKLLAADRISARRAAVLAQINSLLLRTLPAIDSDLQDGIVDPTLPQEVVKSEPAVSNASPISANPSSNSAPENASTGIPPSPTRIPQENPHECGIHQCLVANSTLAVQSLVGCPGGIRHGYGRSENPRF